MDNSFANFGKDWWQRDRSIGTCLFVFFWDGRHFSGFTDCRKSASAKSGAYDRGNCRKDWRRAIFDDTNWDFIVPGALWEGIYIIISSTCLHSVVRKVNCSAKGYCFGNWVSASLLEGWKCYFRDPIFQNLPGEHSPGPPSSSRLRRSWLRLNYLFSLFNSVLPISVDK